MKIEKMTIYGYGKWLQKDFTAMNQLQIFLGNNEAGKSTLSSFIHTMFFGFPSARKKDYNTYIPKLGESYGGRLFLSGTRYGEVIIERVKDRNRGKATLTHENGQQEVVDHLAAYLLGVDSETYELLYTFKIDSLLALNKVKKDDLNRYLLGVGTSGSEKMLQVADDYRREAQKEFKPTGTVPPLNKQIKETDKLWSKLQEAKKQNSQYERLLLEVTELSDKLTAVTEEQLYLEKENDDLNEAIRLNDYYQEWLRLTKEMKAVDTSILPKDAEKQWERVQEAIAAGLQRQAALQEQIKAEQSILIGYSHAEWYKEHQSEWHACQHAFADVSSQFSHKQFLEQRKKEEEAEQFLFRQRMGLQQDAALPLSGEEKEAEAQNLLVQEEDLDRQLTATQQALRSCEKSLDALEVKIKETEKKLVSEETFKTWQQLAQHPVISAPKKARGPVIILLLISIISGIAALAFPQWRVYAGVLALIFVILTGLEYRKSQTRVVKVDAGAFRMEDYIQQATWRERLKEMQTEEEVEQERLIQLLNEQEAIEMRLEEEGQKQQLWLRNKHYPRGYSLKRVLDEKPAVTLLQLEEKVAATETELQHLEEDLAKWHDQTAFIRTHFGLEHLSEREFLNQFSQLHQAVVLEESMAKQTQTKINELKNELAEVRDQLEENRQKRLNLLQNANVETEAEFYQLLHAKDEQHNQKRRRDFLGEQLEGKEDLLAKYASKKAAIRQREENTERLATIQTNLKIWQKQEVELCHAIHILESGGTYSSLLQEYAMAETQLRDMIIEWGGKVVAAEWLEETLRYGKENRLPTILDDMSDFFKRLTGDTYSRIVFQKSGLKIQHVDGTVFQPFELSQGTVEQLYIAMRFAFIKNTADIANLPILIDDGFVNFDLERKKVMFQLIEELSHTVQVIFFTFDQNVADYFDQNQINMLN